MYTPLEGDNNHDLPLKKTGTKAPSINILLLGQVIQSILQKGKSFTSVTKIDNALDVLGDNVK